jgi:hypothetical protein
MPGRSCSGGWRTASDGLETVLLVDAARQMYTVMLIIPKTFKWL